MSLSIHRRTGHGRALLSVVCAERNESEFRANREKQETTTSFDGLNVAALCEGWLSSSPRPASDFSQKL